MCWHCNNHISNVQMVLLRRTYDLKMKHARLKDCALFTSSAIDHSKMGRACLDQASPNKFHFEREKQSIFPKT